MVAELIGGYYDGRDVVSWTRDAQGARVWRKQRAEYVCYLKRSDLEEKAERDTKYIHENLTSKVLPGYKG